MIYHSKKSKYRAKPCEYYGMHFDSIGELNRYKCLEILVRIEAISELKRQVKFSLNAQNGTKICDYIADFTYINSDGEFIVEDFKGFKTAIYKLKKKWLKAQYGYEILET